LPPASTDALALALALAVDADDEDDEAELLPLLLQAASIKMAAAPAVAALILRVFDNILAKLLCSVLPYLCVRLPRCSPLPPAAAVLSWPPAASGPRSCGVRSAATTSGCYLVVIVASITVNDRGGSRTATTPSLVSCDPSSSCAVSTSGSVRASPGRPAVTVLTTAGPSNT
jgi:hypothetical protein